MRNPFVVAQFIARYQERRINSPTTNKATPIAIPTPTPKKTTVSKEKGKLNIEYCIIGGLAVNAYVEPVVSLDLDIVAALDGIDKLIESTKGKFKIEKFPHSINLGSKN
jgi:hypothetical protein